MIGLHDIYKVVEAMVPLYFALTLGYGSIRWWGIFSPAECDTINRLVAYFAFPFFAFRFTLNTDPYNWNYRAIFGDVIAKAIIIGSLAAWAKYNKKGSYTWAITSFSLTTLTNALVMGVPLLDAMYGTWAGDLVVQLAVFQAVTWLTLLLFVLELRKALEEMNEETVVELTPVEITRQVTNSRQENTNEGDEARNDTVDVMRNNSTLMVATNEVEPGNNSILMVATNDVELGNSAPAITRRFSFGSLMKVVLVKLAVNPNSYASLIGITWALIASRYDFTLPAILDGCVYIMARTGTGMAMFSMGIFMATQEKALACGTNLTLVGMVLRFVAGPVAMAIGCLAAGLRGDALRAAIIQAAIPQSITSFVYAREYGLHADVISTAVIFGMLVSLPLLVLYYIILEFVR